MLFFTNKTRQMCCRVEDEGSLDFALDQAIDQLENGVLMLSAIRLSSISSPDSFIIMIISSIIFMIISMIIIIVINIMIQQRGWGVCSASCLQTWRDGEGSP